MTDTDTQAVFNITLATVIVLIIAVFPWWTGLFTIIRWLIGADGC